MAFMKFYVGNEANASSHLDGIYIAIDTKKIYYNGDAYGGEDIDLSKYATKGDLNKYFPITGGIISGNDRSRLLLRRDSSLNALKFEFQVANVNDWAPIVRISTDGKGIEDSNNPKGFIQLYSRNINNELIGYYQIGGNFEDQVGATGSGLRYINSSNEVTDSTSLWNTGGSTTAISDIVTQVTAAIVDGAPTTLDTLNELAAALGDDPNFATTITNQIAQKADKTVATSSTDGLMSASDKKRLDDSIYNFSVSLHSYDNGATGSTADGLVFGLDCEHWGVPSGSHKYTREWVLPIVSADTNGVMSIEDKAKLDNLSGLANKNFILATPEASVADDSVYFENSSGDQAYIYAATSERAGVMSKADKIKLDNYPNYSELLEFLGIVLVDLPSFPTTRVTSGSCMSNPSGNLNLVNALSTDQNLYVFGLVSGQQVHDLIGCGTGNYSIPSQYSSILTSLTGNPKFKDVIIFDNTIISGGKYFVPVNENTKLYRCETLIDAIRHLNSDPIS